MACADGSNAAFVNTVQSLFSFLFTLMPRGAVLTRFWGCRGAAGKPAARDAPVGSMGAVGGGKGIALMFRVLHVYFLSAEAL